MDTDEIEDRIKNLKAEIKRIEAEILQSENDLFMSGSMFLVMVGGRPKQIFRDQKEARECAEHEISINRVDAVYLDSFRSDGSVIGSEQISHDESCDCPICDLKKNGSPF